MSQLIQDSNSDITDPHENKKKDANIIKHRDSRISRRSEGIQTRSPGIYYMCIYGLSYVCFRNEEVRILM